MGRLLSYIYSFYMYVFIIKVTHNLVRYGEAHKKVIKEKQETNPLQSHLPTQPALTF